MKPRKNKLLDYVFKNRAQKFYKIEYYYHSRGWAYGFMRSNCWEKNRNMLNSRIKNILVNINETKKA